MILWKPLKRFKTECAKWGVDAHKTWSWKGSLMKQLWTVGFSANFTGY